MAPGDKKTLQSSLPSGNSSDSAADRSWSTQGRHHSVRGVRRSAVAALVGPMAGHSSPRARACSATEGRASSYIYMRRSLLNGHVL